jgi:hypothetical protein
MLNRFLFSPGKSLKICSSSLHPISSTLSLTSKDSSENISESLQNSILFPEIFTFDRILKKIENHKNQDLEVYQGPINLRQKILTRALLNSATLSENSSINLKELKQNLEAPFQTHFETLLQTQGFQKGSELTEYIEHLRERFDAMDNNLDTTQKSSWSRLIFSQMIMHIGIFGALFYTTYFWKDWEVVEPISYLVVVGFNLIYLGSLIYSRRVSGSQINILNSPRTSKLLKQRLNFSLNRKRFHTFYYEYQEILRNLN